MIEHDPSTTFSDRKITAPKVPYLQLINKYPNGGQQKHQPGTLVMGNPGTVVEQVRATLLYCGYQRKVKRWANGKMEVLCQSFDNEFPAARIGNPFCRKSDQHAIATLLAKYDWLDKARIQAIVSQVTESGRLAKCMYRTEEGYEFPLCPAARKDEFGNKAPCDQSFAFEAIDTESQTLFRMEVKGLSLQDWGGYKSPLREFQEYCRVHQVPYYHLEVTLHAAVGPKGFYVLGVRDIQVIEDVELQKIRRTQYENAKNNVLVESSKHSADGRTTQEKVEEVGIPEGEEFPWD